MQTIRALTAAAILTLPVPAVADTFSATVVTDNPAIFRWVRMLDEAFYPTVNEVLAEHGHEMEFDRQYASIAGVGESVEVLENGLAEFGVCSTLFDAAKLGPQNVSYYTPFVTADPRMVSEIMDRLHDDEPLMRQAYLDNGITFLGAPIAIDDYMLMTTFPVTSLSDLEGRRIAAPGAATNWLSGTGAVGVSGSLSTYYNELSTGVYEGVVVFASAALPARLHEVAPNVLRAGLGAQFAGGVCTNTDWYESLPSEVQGALIAGADAARDWYIADLEVAIENALTVLESEGAVITDASPEMREAWANGMDNAAAIWAEDLDSRGEPGTEILNAYMQEMRDAGATPLRNWDQE